MENNMKMTAQEMIRLLDTAKENDEKLDELGDYLCELADDDKKIDVGVIEALFKIYERLNDPSQSLFNALESCVMGSQEKIVRKLARESALRKPNHCNLQLVGDSKESIKLLKEIKNQPKLDSEIRTIVMELIDEAEDE
jgi:hypothetical protein